MAPGFGSLQHCVLQSSLPRPPCWATWTSIGHHRPKLRPLTHLDPGDKGRCAVVFAVRGVFQAPLSWFFLLPGCRRAIPLHHGAVVEFDGRVTRHCAAVAIDADGMVAVAAPPGHDAGMLEGECLQPKGTFEVFGMFVSS